MNRIIQTKDFSPTVFSERFQQTYHSIHGAIAESNHVFIQHGLEEKAKEKNHISIFEMGFGTGLNAALTWQYAEQYQLDIHYTTLEKYPLSTDLSTTYQTLDENLNIRLNLLHQAVWDIDNSFENFHFEKLESDIVDFQTKKGYDIIYYDAFAPNAQPELWTDIVFTKMYDILLSGGILTTYCSKGEVKRTLKRCGFEISSPPGPLGKREMTIARKS